MLIIPAIDMKDHEVVRLKQGDMQQATSYSSSIVDQAATWIDQGTTRLHLVDLNGAFAGKPFHLKEVSTIAKAHPEIAIQVGGGIRNLETLQMYFEAGVSFCILGTAAIRDPDFLQKAIEAYPQKIILGVDAKNGLVAVDGWAETSTKSAEALIENFSKFALDSVVYTDISKDGMLNSMNFDEIANVAKLGLPVIASGGLTSLQDIQKLKAMQNILGVIAGKALYENRFSLKDAVELAQSC